MITEHPVYGKNKLIEKRISPLVEMNCNLRLRPNEEIVIFNNNPTPKDVIKAHEEGNLICCNSLTKERALEVSERFKNMDPVFLWSIQMWLLPLSDEGFKNYILDSLKRVEKEEMWYPGTPLAEINRGSLSIF